MENYYIASCSCGKDSMAMVLKLICNEEPLDEIVFYDTGMEFEAIYKNWKFIKRFAGENGVKCTVLRPDQPFTYTMLEKPVNVGRENEHKGYSWCGGTCRWGTTAKLKALDAYCESKNAIVYVGIAADERNRLNKKSKPYKRFPLAMWGMTEKDCLDYCRRIGVDWKEPSEAADGGFVDLYDILDRVSCWCCGNKNLWELYNIWKYLFDDYWCRLRYLQFCQARPFKNRYSIFDLEKRFEIGLFDPEKRRWKRI